MKKSVLFLLAIFASAFIFAQEDTTVCDNPEIHFGKANVAITIDADGSDAVWEATDPTANLGYTGTTAADITAEDLSYTMKGAWDDNGLYFLFEVKDDVLVRKMQEDPEADDWMVDCIEMFFNPTGKRSVEAAGTNFAVATQARIKIGDEEKDTLQLGGRFINVWADADPALFDYAVDYPAGGYLVEAFINWDAILPDSADGDVFTLGNRIGFSVNVADSDDPEVERDAIAVWAGAGLGDNQWNDINYMGHALLDGPIIGIQTNEVSSFNVYPNPATDVLRVEGATEVSIFNITGQLVKTANVLNGTVDVADLTSGVYVVKSGAQATQVVIK